MSLSIDGQFICCDGVECGSVARIPVGLRSVLSRGGPTGSVRGWLFISRGDQALHLCPKCIASYSQEGESAISIDDAPARSSPQSSVERLALEIRGRAVGSMRE